MDINEFLEVSTLMGYYKELLSDRQKDYMEKHFEEDYSLSEIAEEYSVSRQAVHDNIKRGINILREYESKLGFYNRDSKIRKELELLLNNFDKKKMEIIIEEFL